MSKEIGALMLALIVATPVAAAPWGAGRRPGMEPQRGGNPPGQAVPWREPQQDRNMQRNNEQRQPGHALTEEERQALRRDLNKADRELYRRRR